MGWHKRYFLSWKNKVKPFKLLWKYDLLTGVTSLVTFKRPLLNFHSEAREALAPMREDTRVAGAPLWPQKSLWWHQGQARGRQGRGGTTTSHHLSPPLTCPQCHEVLLGKKALPYGAVSTGESKWCGRGSHPLKTPSCWFCPWENNGDGCLPAAVARHSVLCS